MYIAPWSPLPGDFGGAQRVHALWRTLQRVGDVRLLVVGHRPPPAVRARLRAEDGTVFPPRIESPRRRVVRLLSAVAAGECIPAARYLSRRRIARLVARAAEAKPDVIVVGDEYLSVLIPALAPLGARIVLDTHNAASRGHARVAASSRNPFTKAAYLVLARNSAAVERRFFPLADEVWAVSEDDAAFYTPLSAGPVRVVPNVVDVPADAGAAGEPGTVAFVASYSYWPNEDAALRLIRMARTLRGAGALAKILLVGIAPTPAMRRAAAGRDEVVVTGAVPDVAPFLRRASVVAIPLSAGSGTKLKVLEALAHGRPVVTTPIGAEGIALKPGVHADVAGLGDFENALAALLRDPDRRARLAAAGRALVMARYSPAVLERAVAEALPPPALARAGAECPR